MSITFPENTIMELQIFAAKPMSNPVIPSFRMMIVNSMTPEYSKVSLGNTVWYRIIAIHKEKPTLVRLGVLFIPKKGAMNTNAATLTNIIRKYSNVYNENP
jgi:hypothetical protein